MHRRRTFCGQSSSIALTVAVLTGGFASAADVKVQTVLSGLRSPCSVAVRPESAGTPYDVFVADCGVGRVVQVNTAVPAAASDVIAGFAVSNETSDATSALPGIHSILFLDRARIVVAGGEENGQPFLWLYDLSDSDSTLKADEHKQEVEVARPNQSSNTPVQAFHVLARTQANDRVSDTLVVTASAEGSPAGLWRVGLRANTLNETALPDAANAGGRVGAIGGIAVASEGYIVTACGPARESKSGMLKFVSPIDGRTLLEIETRLPRIAGLAFSPSNGNLYAVNLAPKDQGGGVYRIDDANEPEKFICKEVKIAEADRPTSLAFGPDGALYVTTLGDDGDDTQDSGSLIKLTGDL